MTTQEVHDLIGQQSKRAADEWFRIQCRDPYAAVYVYYRTGEIQCFAGDAPAGWTIGIQHRLSCGDTREQVQRQIAEAARRFPFLPVT